MSVFVYNNVWVQDCRTLEFRMEVERDPTNTDIIYNVYTIRVRGFLATSAGAFPGVSDSLSSAATIAIVKNALQSPRRAFSYSIAGTTLVEVGSGVAMSLDAKLGPIPLPTIVREVSAGSFMVECGVVCKVIDCSGDCERSPVISLRWSQVESFDQNWNSNLTTMGTLIVRSDLLQSADNFRPLATPPLLTDYVRRLAKYTLSPDGLQLAFHFEDREVDRLPPAPATTAKGMFTVVCEKPGFKRVGQVDLHLEGPKGTNRRDLLTKALKMAYSKLQAEGLFQESGVPIVWGTFREDLFEPAVDVSIQAMLPPLDGGGWGASALGGVAAGVAGLTTPGQKPAPQVMRSVGQNTDGLSQNRPGIAPPDRKRLAGLLTAAFRDPCACLVSEASLTATGYSTTQRNTDITTTLQNVPAEITVSELSTLPQPIPLVDDKAPYDTYNVETTTHFNSGKIQMPGTGVGDGGNNSIVLQATGAMLTVTTTFVAGRTGKPPVLPNFQSGQEGLIPLYGTIVEQATIPSPDGAALVFMVSGFYVHAVSNLATYQLTGSRVPYVTEATAEAGAGAAGFWANLFNTVGAGAAEAGGGANPFVAGGVTEGVPPVNPLGQLNTPPGQFAGIGGFVDTSNVATGGDDPFFNPPSVRP